MNDAFRKKVASKSDSELLGIYNLRSRYDPKFVAAAIDEIQKRKLQIDDIESVRKQLNIDNQPDSMTDKESSSKIVILLVSILFMPLFGSILLAFNLYDRKKNR